VRGQCQSRPQPETGRALHHIRLNICPHLVLVVDVYG